MKPSQREDLVEVKDRPGQSPTWVRRDSRMKEWKWRKFRLVGRAAMIHNSISNICPLVLQPCIVKQKN